MSRVAAARFSFLLSTPVIVGAAILSIKDLLGSSSDGNFTIFVVGVVSAAIVGWLTIKFLLKFVITNSFNIFVWYRIALAAIIALLLFFE